MIRIALTNLKKYNEGELIFEWVDLPCDDSEEVFDRIGHNEYFISDWECDLNGVKIREYDNIHELNELTQQLIELNSYELKELGAILEAHHVSLNEAFDILNAHDFTLYESESIEDVAETLVNEGCFGEIPETIKNYIDYEKIARDLECDGYTETTFGVIIFY